MEIFDELNEKQAEAVRYTEGPLLILAGAGSGKTRTLTARVAYLVKEKGVRPENIMAITFTNKAADEMRERIERLVGFGADAIWVSTFHSACARILRRYAERLGYGNNFSIYDTDDSKTLMKNVLGVMDVDIKKFPPKRVVSAVSSFKNRGLTPADAADEAAGPDGEIIAEAFEAYEKRLFENNAMDFDNLLLKTVELLKKEPDVLEGYRNRLHYISVDEYQDTNIVQFELVRLLAGKHGNLCVVGDDDQSIYKFRGADIRNILEFEKYFPDAKVIKLEQNYRSYGNILKGANAVIANNVGRKGKTLWTGKEGGAKIDLITCLTAPDEAAAIVSAIKERKRAEGLNWDSFAVLYRTNAQSRLIEEKLMFSNVPYQIIGGVNFYSRREIKDVMAYLKTVDNPKDDMSVKRIINVPRRGIGDKTIYQVEKYASAEGISFFGALGEAGRVPELRNAAEKIKKFVLFIKRLKVLTSEIKVSELIETVINDTGYLKELEDERTDEALERIANIDELISKAVSYEEGAAEASLSGFLQDVALVADIDSYDENAAKVLLMTIHSSKGLEFDQVFLTGLEEGLFPGFRSIYDADAEELEEERRLCYVGMTRAKRRLTLTYAKERMQRGETQVRALSRFAEEIPAELLNEDPGRYGFYYGKNRNWRGETFKKEPGRGYFPYSGNTRKAVGAPKVFRPDEFKVTKPESLPYAEGDRVRHKKYGCGTVKEIKNEKDDFKVAVEFDDFGERRMSASYAKLEKL